MANEDLEVDEKSEPLKPMSACLICGVVCIDVAESPLLTPVDK